ncbi:alpha/beta-hydrolase [Acephala macrosclerotiorum]|nr:alpha/beta-hydrolase [Acephala macrosclerotiorum]
MMASPSTKVPLAHHYANTADGSKISYYTAGAGPGVLVLHGAVSYALTHTELAEVLSPYYTVHIVSRRGRGLSSGYPTSVTELPVTYKANVKGNENATSKDNDNESTIHLGDHTYPRNYNPAFTAAVLDCSLRDLDTLLAATGAKYVIGASSGALILLRALLTAASPTLSSSFLNLKSIAKAIVFEPPLLTTSRPSTFDLSAFTRFERETATGDEVGALITAARCTQLGPAWIPRWVMWILSTFSFAAQEKAEKKRLAAGGEERGNCTFKGLGGMLRYDFAVVEGMIGGAERWRVLEKKEGNEGPSVDILLLSGTQSPGYLKQSMDFLVEEIRGAKRVVIDGVGHGALGSRILLERLQRLSPVFGNSLVESRRVDCGSWIWRSVFSLAKVISLVA